MERRAVDELLRVRARGAGRMQAAPWGRPQRLDSDHPALALRAFTAACASAAIMAGKQSVYQVPAFQTE